MSKVGQLYYRWQKGTVNCNKILLHLCIVCRIQYITPPPPGEEGKEKERGKEKRKKDGFKRKEKI